jgi:hypothetical protein
VDTFFGKIVWLKVWTGNHDPNLIEMFYLKALKEHNLFPYATRSDYGTETLGIYKISEINFKYKNRKSLA